MSVGREGGTAYRKIELSLSLLPPPGVRKAKMTPVQRPEREGKKGGRDVGKGELLFSTTIALTFLPWNGQAGLLRPPRLFGLYLSPLGDRGGRKEGAKRGTAKKERGGRCSR